MGEGAEVPDGGHCSNNLRPHAPAMVQEKLLRNGAAGAREHNLISGVIILYPVQYQERENIISFQDLKKFLSKVNCKVPTRQLKEKLAALDSKTSGDIYFDDFCSVLQVRDNQFCTSLLY